MIGGLVSASTLVLLNYGVSVATYRNKKLEALVEGRPQILIHNGKLFEDVVAKAHLTHHELNAALRQAGCSCIEEVHSAILENRRHGQLVDVRSADEFTGKILAPPGLSETAQRAGHIPGAANIPWAQATNEDGTFKSYEELKKLYDSKGITGNDGVIAYCRIGERSSHTWFVLKYLLGYDQVRNYDGSWTEWGNLIGAPIVNETRAAQPAVAVAAG